MKFTLSATRLGVCAVFFAVFVLLFFVTTSHAQSTQSATPNQPSIQYLPVGSDGTVYTADTNPTFEVTGVVSGASVTITAVSVDYPTAIRHKTVTASGTTVTIRFSGSTCDNGDTDTIANNACTITTSASPWRVTATQTEAGKTVSSASESITVVISSQRVDVRPTALTLKTTAVDGVITTPVPTITVSLPLVTNDLQLFSDSSCETAVSRVILVESAEQDITTNALLAGTYTIYAKYAGSWNNVQSQCSTASVTFTVDVVNPPNQPTILGLPTTQLSQTIRTSDPHPTFVISGVENGATVTVRAQRNGHDDRLYKTVTASGTTVNVPFTGNTCDSEDTDTVADDPCSLGAIGRVWVVDAIQRVPNKNASFPSSNVNVQMTTLTSLIIPSALSLKEESDTGASNSDGITKDNTPTVTVSLPVINGKVVIYTDESCEDVISTPVTVTDYQHDITTNAITTDGEYTLYAKYIDTVGNVNPICSSHTTLTITIDTTAPTAPTHTDWEEEVPEVNDQNWTGTTPPISIQVTEEGGSVTLYTGDNCAVSVSSPIEVGTLITENIWFTPSAVDKDTQHLFRTRHTDIAGNESTCSSSYTGYFANLTNQPRYSIRWVHA